MMIKRYSENNIKMIPISFYEDPEGDYCKYEDVERLVKMYKTALSDILELPEGYEIEDIVLNYEQ